MRNDTLNKWYQSNQSSIICEATPLVWSMAHEIISPALKWSALLGVVSRAKVLKDFAVSIINVLDELGLGLDPGQLKETGIIINRIPVCMKINILWKLNFLAVPWATILVQKAFLDSTAAIYWEAAASSAFLCEAVKWY